MNLRPDIHAPFLHPETVVAVTPVAAIDYVGMGDVMKRKFKTMDGAWGLLLVPLVTGAGIALRESSHIVPVLWLLVAALALFWL